MEPTAPRGRIGLWGTFDLQRLGDALRVRIARRELAARLPQAEVVAYAPTGMPSPFDGGLPPRPLEEAAGIGAVVVAGGDLLDPSLERCGGPEAPAGAASILRGPGAGTSLAWLGVGIGADPDPETAVAIKAALAGSAIVSVRDDGSRARLETIGVEREVAVIPDLCVLAGGLVDEEMLSRRLDYLRHMGWYPPEGRPAVVEPGSAPPSDAETVVEVTTAPCLDTAPSAGGAAPRTYRLPDDAILEDLLAAMWGGSGFTGSLDGAVTALSLGRPAAIAPATPEADLAAWRAVAGEDAPVAGAGYADPTSLDRARVAEELDRVAASLADIDPAVDEPSPDRLTDLEREVAALRRAYAERSRRLISDGNAFADQIQAQRLPMRRAEALLRSRAFRYTAWIRKAVLALGRPFRRP